jgi:hypothetical protein
MPEVIEEIEEVETIHLYVVREDELPQQPSLLPIALSTLCLVAVVIIGVFTSYQQPVIRTTIRVPAILLPLKTFTAGVAITPIGIKTYPATTAHGVLTNTNGSVISQTIPQGFRLDGVITDTAVFVPAGSANGYGYATVAAHALISGKQGNIAAYTVNQVEGSSVYIRNLSAFSGGRDSYPVKYVTAQDKQTALSQARDILFVQISAYKNGVHYPCKELYLYKQAHMAINWRCQFLTFVLPPYMHVTGIKIIGKNLLLHVWFVARPRQWVVK